MKIHVIDSHTGGEPTRIVIEGGPPLGAGTMAERLDLFRTRYDHYRSAIVNEPRGSDAMVGAILCEPLDPANAAGIIFFNNVGYLNMCGHGTIGLGATLAHLGRIQPGVHTIETPVGNVSIELHQSGEFTVGNVPSYRSAANVAVEVDGRTIKGDIAWGGNWFFLTYDTPCELELRNIEQLTDYTLRSTTSKCFPVPQKPMERTSSYAPARLTTDPLAVPAPAPNLRASMRTANSRKVKSGGRRASSAACLRALSRSVTANCSRRSKVPRTSMPMLT
jgi:proline racemase